MIDMGKYWDRVEVAARLCMICPGRNRGLMSYSHCVLLSDLCERIQELEKEPEQELVEIGVNTRNLQKED